MNLIRFGVENPVPINLIMIALLIGGAITAMSLRREFFPDSNPDQAMVTIPYPGATPEEIEATLGIKVENKLIDLDEIKELHTTISEGGGGITVEFREGVDVDDAMDKIEREIDSLIDLPEESEKIQVSLFEPRIPVIRVMLFGHLDERILKQAIRGIQDDLNSLPRMGEIVLEGVRDYEIRVDVQTDSLLEHGISLPEVSEKIREWMVDVPGGTVRSNTNNIKVRTMGVPQHDEAISDIIIRADEMGHTLRISNIAEITESFVDEQIINRFNGLPAAGLTIFKVGDQDIVDIAKMVRAYVAGRQGKSFKPYGLKERLVVTGLANQLKFDLRSNRHRAWQLGQSSATTLPPGAEIALSFDFARFVEGRLELLLRNAKYGGILVFLTLLLFLNWRVAIWVGIGLLTALMGTLILMASIDVTLNLLTMFGLIVVLGLIVDDAIVVSENIQTLYDQGTPALGAAVRGTQQVLWPVVATVLTSIVAFLPLTFVKGRIGDLLGALPLVVACALAVSLMEAILILPSHIGHTLAKRDHSKPHRFGIAIRQAEKWRDHFVLGRVIPAYGWVVAHLLRHRYLTIVVALATLIISLGLVKGKRLDFTFYPDSDAENIIVDLRMPIGTSIGWTNRIVTLIEEAARSQDETLNVSSVIGKRSNIDTGITETFATHVSQIFIELKFVEQRVRESSQVISAIRQALNGKIDDVAQITFTEMSGGPGGPDISIRVSGKHLADINAAVAELKQMLATYDGVFDIADDSDLGQSELQININPTAKAQGFSTHEVARQVRGFLYGIDAHVFAAEQEDINVRVRLHEQTRRSLFAIQNIWVISPTGQSVPLTEIATIKQRETYATIKRIDRKRAVTITAYTAPRTNPETIVAQLNQVVQTRKKYSTKVASIQQVVSGLSPIDQLRQKFPHVEITFSGRQQQLADAFGSLPYGFLVALLMIYLILAWLFSSYLLPIVILLAVPFAIIGVVWGHLLFGYQLTFLSLIGFVALSGIVVNDSLIFVQSFNKQRKAGHDILDSLIAAGRARLRPILLTTATTVLGLTPLILERSFQAKFLIPMAISIAMGLMAATVLVLIVLPCLILVLDDAMRAAYCLWYGSSRPKTAKG